MQIRRLQVKTSLPGLRWSVRFRKREEPKYTRDKSASQEKRREEKNLWDGISQRDEMKPIVNQEKGEGETWRLK